MQIWGYGGIIIRLHPPNIFIPHISELDDVFFWSSLHFRQEIGDLGSDDDFFLVFTSLHFTVVGRNLGNRARCHICEIIPPISKNGQFCRSIPPNAQHRFAPLMTGSNVSIYVLLLPWQSLGRYTVIKCNGLQYR